MEKKIAIIGSSGAGKSTLARALGNILQIEVIHLDSLFWQAGWKEMPREQWKEIQQQLVQKDAWIMDGSYHDTLDIRINAANTVIFLDMPLFLRIRRVIKRHFTEPSRPDLSEHCLDKLDWNYLVKVGDFTKKDRERLIKHLQEAQKSGKETLWLHSEGEVSRYLQKVREEAGQQTEKGCIFYGTGHHRQFVHAH